jgi:hypothetical protein
MIDADRKQFRGTKEDQMHQLRQHLLSAAEQCPIGDVLFEAALVARREGLPVEAAKSIAKGIFAAKENL